MKKLEYSINTFSQFYSKYLNELIIYNNLIKFYNFYNNEKKNIFNT